MTVMATALATLIAGLTPEGKAELDIRARGHLARAAYQAGDVLTWGQAVMPEKFHLPFCEEMHGTLVQHRADPLVALMAPRGHAKTTIKCNLIPLYQALNEPKRFDYYLHVQANDEKALAVNRSIKAEIEENKVLKYAYGDQMTDRWTTEEFVLKNGVVFKAVGAGVSLRGVNYRNRRPQYVSVDDLYNEEDIHNPTATLKKNDWLKSTLYKSMATGERTAFHVQGTAINKCDILTEMASWPGCFAKTFKAIKKDGKPLWPELNSLESLERDKIRMGSVIFNREMMNECQDDSEAIVKASWLQNWEYDPRVRWAKGFKGDFRLIAVRLSCDPSIGAKMLDDFSGMALVIVTASEDTRYDYWIEGLWNEKLSLDGRVKLLNTIYAQQNAKGPEWRVTEAPLEGIAGFKDFVAEVKRRTSIPVKEISWVKDKISNLESKSSHFENGRVHISNAIPKLLRDELISQLTNNTPRHDDLRDAVLLTLEDQVISMKDWV